MDQQYTSMKAKTALSREAETGIKYKTTEVLSPN